MQVPSLLGSKGYFLFIINHKYYLKLIYNVLISRIFNPWGLWLFRQTGANVAEISNIDFSSIHTFDDEHNLSTVNDAPDSFTPPLSQTSSSTILWLDWDADNNAAILFFLRTGDLKEAFKCGHLDLTVASQTATTTATSLRRNLKEGVPIFSNIHFSQHRHKHF